MIIKKKNTTLAIVIAIAIAIAMTVVLLSDRTTRQMHNFSLNAIVQKIMSSNIGFSSLGNLSDSGEGGSEDSIFTELNVFFKSIPRIIKYNLSDSDKFERLDININFKNYLVINEDRRISIKNKLLLNNPTEVIVELKHKGVKYNAKLRLKGDTLRHWQNTPRTSFRVKLKDKKTIFGLSKFSIQKPLERQHPYDYLFQSLMRDAGSLSPLHKYVHVYVNGEDWGIMNIEEHISKELLEKQKRKSSAVFRFSDERLWLYQDTSSNYYHFYRLSDPILNLKIYNKNKVIYKNENRKIYSYILKNRLKENLDIYDINSLSMALVLSAIWGEFHVLHDNNTRYYFNPYTLKLETITTDQTYWYPVSNADETINHAIPKHYLDIIKTKIYSESLPNNMQNIVKVIPNLERHISDTQELFPLDLKKNYKVIRDNIQKITSNKNHYLKNLNIFKTRQYQYLQREFTMPTKQQASEFNSHVHIKHYTDGNIEIYNLVPDNVSVKNILFNGKPILTKKTIVPSYLTNPEPTIIKTPFKGIQDKMFIVETQYQGFDGISKNDITIFSDEIKNPLLLTTSQEFDFINKLDNNSFEIKQGNWDVNEPIIVNGDLHISPSVNLQFSKDAYIIVKGSLTAIGSEANPITLKAISGSWKGVYVLNADKKSHLKNVSISNLSALEDGLLKLTGGITFYKSDVDFENVKINDIKAEDALNIVESNFTLNSVYINNTVSDGLDSDFSKGSVSNSEFSDIGGDALDFSGSNVSIEATEAKNIKDKAVSAGEKSTLTVKNSTFNNIGVGVASKDGSSVAVTDTKILNYKLYAAMTYLKKDFYDMPSLTINNTAVSDGRAYIRQKGTSMTVDGIYIPETKISVKKLYKTKVMAK